MTDNQDRQFSQDQTTDRDRQQQQQANQAGQQNEVDQYGQQGRQDRQQGEYGQQGQQDPAGQYGQRDQQQDQYRGQDENNLKRDDLSGISGGAPGGQGGGAEQYGMATDRARNQQQQEVGHDQKIQEDHDSADGQSGAGGSYGS